MFKSIADIQIKTQEKLSSKLPDRVNELVKQLKVCDDEQARDYFFDEFSERLSLFQR
jgi:pyruvate dehydrogenase complex dehydrogenase (E1) component